MPYAFSQIVVRRADDAHVHGFFASGADFANAFFLYRAQQFHLHGQRQVRDLIQKQCPSVSRLKKSVTVFVRTGERAFFVTEEFVFHQVARDGPAVHRDKWLVMPRTALHDEPGRQFLATARFAADMHRRLAARHTFNELAHLLHGRRMAEQHFVARWARLGKLQR